MYRKLENEVLETVSGGEFNFSEMASNAWEKTKACGATAWDTTKDMAGETWRKSPVCHLGCDLKTFGHNAIEGEFDGNNARDIAVDAMGIAFIAGGVYLTHKAIKKARSLMK